MTHEPKLSLHGVSTKAVVYNEEGKLLTLFRTETAPARPNTWDLPGGDLDFGEDPAQATVREIKEETGLDVGGLKIFDVHSYINQEGLHWLTLGYKCIARGTDVTLSYEHNDYRWVTPEEFLELESAKKLQQFVQNSAK